MAEADRPDDRRLAHNPIAIVGLAGLFPMARDVREFWSNILDAVDCVTEVPPTHWRPADYYDPDPAVADRTYARRGGFLPEVPFNPMEFGFPPNLLDVTGVVQLLSLVVARDVLADAGATGSTWFDPERTGVVLGVTGPTSLAHPLAARLETPVLREVVRAAGLTDREATAVAEAFSLAFPPWEENSFPGLLGNVIAGRIANRLDLGGTNYTVDSACASALTAVRAAIGELLDHRADLMITGGCDTENTIFSYMCFSKTQALSRSDRIQPFDAGADGTLVGEGIGMLALKRLADAERDGDRVYAVIRGLGASSDGRFRSIYAPRAEGQLRALRRAYDDAGVSPASVELFEAHATGTPVGDQTELTALTSILRDAGARPASAAIGSVKSQIGHTKGAAGAASMIKLSLALHTRVLPPTINVSTPTAVLAAADSPVYANTRTRPWVLDPDLGRRRAAASAMGFGGTNFHVVLEEAPRGTGGDVRTRGGTGTGAPGSGLGLHRAARAHLWHAPTPAELVDLLRSGARPNGDDGIPASAARVGFAARAEPDVERLRSLAAEQIAARPEADEWSHPAGIHYRRQALAEPTVGVLFAGQGSQYVGMGLEAAVDLPPVAGAFDAANGFFAGADPTLARAVFPPPSFDPAAEARHEATLTRTEYAQPAIGALAAGQFRFLRELGLRPAGLLGHSFGELTALWAAGAIGDPDFFRLARARGQAMAPPAGDPDLDPGTMAAVRASREDVATALADHPDVMVCNHNAPDQVVVGGPTAAVDAFVAAAAERGLDARRIPVAAAFHTPLVAHAVDAFAAALAGVEIAAPAVPVYANTAGAGYGDDPAANRRVLTEQLRRPVEFVAGLRAMRAAGVNVFVEVGPGRVLTGLVGRTLGDEVVAVPADAGRGKDGGVALMAAAVRLAVLGVELTGLNRYAAEPTGHPEPSALTVGLTGANHVSEPRRRAYRGALAALAASAATRNQPGTPADGAAAPDAAGADALAVVRASAAASAASTSAATAAADAGPHAGVAGRVSSTGAFVADLSELARDHLALHTQFLDSQLRVAEGLVGVLRATPATAGSADKIRAAADAVVRQSLAVGDAHIRVNEILASLASLELDGGGAQRAASAGTAGPIAAATGTPPVAYSTEAPWPSRSLASAPPAPSSALVDIPTQPVPVSGNGSGKADFGGPTQWLPLGVDLSPGTAPVSAAPTSTLSTGAAPASGTGANGAGSAGAAADSTAGPSGVAADPPAGTAPDPSVVVSAVAEVVAEKTGYPAEVLEPSMALESDLGVDSIKRVQILGALQDRFPGVPTVGPERLAELRTLEDIARFLRDGLGADASPSAAGTVVDAGVVAGDAPAPPGAPAAAGAAGTAEIQRLRLAIRRVPAVDPLDTPFGADPRAVVVDVGGRGAAALARRLEATGMRVQVVTLAAGLASPGVGTATLASWDGGDAEAALAALGDLPRLDLCLLVVGDADTDGGTDSGTGEEGAGNALDGALTGAAAGAVSPGAVSRRLADAVMVASRLRAALGAAAAAGRRAAFVAVTRIDGLLGHGGKVPPPAAMAGGVAGLVKTFAREAPEVFCRMLDVHPALGEDAWVDTVLREITDSARDVVEIGVDGESRRWSVEYTDDPADDDPADGPTDSAAARPPVDASDVLVVTGGARGVTARCVEELARECPGELVLLGRTEPADDPGWAVGVPDEGLRAAAVAAASAEGRAVNLPEAHAAARAVAAARDARATLAALTAAGARVRHLAVDVTDPAATARALAPYRDRVTGVVHGAGALADALLADKTPAAVRTVLAAKLDGLWSVLGALDGAPLRHLVLFTSVAGVFGNPGQADYATANEALVRVAASLRGRLAGRVVALNWGAWDGGMVTPDLRELFRSRGVALLPPDEGARRFAAELLAGDGGDRAVLIGGSSPLADGSDRPAPAPFVAHRSLAGLQADPVIDDHQIGPAPVLPATAGLGWLVNVVERANPGYQVVRARGFEVHKGIVLDGSHVRDYWLDARPADGDGGARPGDGTVTVTAAVRSDSGAALPASHYAATLVLAPAPAPGSSTPATPTSALTAPRAAGWPGYRLGEQGEDAGFVYAEGILSHGPLLAGIRRLLVRERTRLVAECRLPDSPIAAGAFAGRLHSPALCDVLVATASLLGRWYLGDAGCLPLGIADAEFFAPIPDDEPFVAVIDDLREGSTGVTVTATACTPDGRVLQRLTGVALVPTPDMADLIREAARRRDSRARTNDGPGTHGPRTDVGGAEGRAEKETGR